ncbi:MAG: cytochrome c oxidase subunit II [Pseudomonadota bacterium]
MSPDFHLLPATASEGASRFNALALATLLMTGLVALILCVLVTWFCIRYRAGSKASREQPPSGNRTVEVLWIVVPLLLFFVVFGWAAYDYAGLYRPNPAATPIYVVAKQWVWKAQHQNGRREIGEVHLAAGQPVRIVMTSQDVIHSFFVPAFRVKQDVVPGRYTSIYFTPTKPGVYHLFCAEFCGTEHATMSGRIVVMSPPQFGTWLQQGTAVPGMAARGFALFRRYGCSGCHAAGSSVHAPDLTGLIGRRVHLQDGRELTADAVYVRDSILLPHKDVVAGYAPIMPSFAGQIDEEDLLAMIEYIKENAHDERSTQPRTP